MTPYNRIKAACLALSASSMLFMAHAVPAKPGLIRFDNNGDTISVILRGDEHSHYYTTADGYALIQDADGALRYAVELDGELTASQIKAKDPGLRDPDALSLLAGIDRERQAALLTERMTRDRRKTAPKRIADESLLNTFPTTGSPRCIAILVEFQDKGFTLDNPRQVFDDMLNKGGFDKDGATGSVIDFFTASSNGQFTPHFDVYGPVKLPQNMSYYGGNDSSGNDIRPYEMLIHAAGLLDDTVDFSNYDTDDDGFIDNVYIFYAGYGEADGGPANSVWPHSWNIHDDLGMDYYFDGKMLNHYATSNELTYGSTRLAGIGVFCHEFSHVLGLPDLYSTTYTSTFTPGEWSLMDHGSYNNDGHTPPTHTAYERYCLGWIEPKVLNDPANITMFPMSQIGNYDDAYIIHTENHNEYYILENRQQKSWDQYIPGHGLLVWHIDFVPDIWTMNIVNITKQYVDIVEADNEQSEYSRTGDPFPGSANVTEFTDDTTPSMKSWNGNPLYSPITNITEENGIISFMFKGGNDIFDPVVATGAEDIKAGGFTACWQQISKASGYLLSVYTRNGDSKEYVDGFIKLNVGDTDRMEVTGLTPDTHYFYVVQATNGRFYSAESNEMAVTTLEATLDYKKVNALPATEITGTSFTAAWQPLEDADYYTVTLFNRQLGDPFTVCADFTDRNLPQGWEISGCSYDSRSAYSVDAPSLKLGADGSVLTTGTYNAGIRSLSFWYRSSTSPNANSLVIKGFVNGEWVEIETFGDLTNETGGKTVTIGSIPAGCTRMSIGLDRAAGTGNVCIDDVTVGYGGNYELLPIDGQTDINVGNVLSYTFTGLESESSYSYSVTAHNAMFSSIESDRIPVITTAGISDAATVADVTITAAGNCISITVPSESQATIYYPTGQIVTTLSLPAGSTTISVPTPGLYIVRTPGKTAKVIAG